MGRTGDILQPGRQVERGIYILTIKEKDGDHDKSSRLNREDAFRVNLGVRKNTFVRRFGAIPKRPQKGGIVDMSFDFSEADRIIPHPVYAWMSWICVINPSEQTFVELKPLIDDAYEYAKEKYAKKR